MDVNINILHDKYVQSFLLDKSLKKSREIRPGDLGGQRKGPFFAYLSKILDIPC